MGKALIAVGLLGALTLWPAVLPAQQPPASEPDSVAMRTFLDYRGYFSARDDYCHDAQLLIPLQVVGDHVAEWDHFIAEYPTFVWRAEADSLRKRWLTTFLVGSDNSSVFDFLTPAETLKTEARLAYQDFLSRHSRTVSGKVVARYYRVLQSEGFRWSAKVKAFLKSLPLGDGVC